MPSVLVVEDSLAQSTQIRLMLKSAEFDVLVAENGREALDVLASHPPDVVLTDLQMPEMDGLNLVKAMRDSYPRIPVVLMTRHGSEEIAMEALRNGAASYLPKNQLHHYLVGTLDDILESARQAHRQKLVQRCRFRTEFQYRIDNDPSLIAPLSAQVELELEDQQFSSPAVRRQMGVALRKALENAIYHGNLQLSEDDRADGELVYRGLAQERCKQFPYQDRRVWLTVSIDEAEAVLTVRDEGPGFETAKYAHPEETINLDEIRGSGLFLIRTFMDAVEHNAVGNEIRMIKRHDTAEHTHTMPPAVVDPPSSGERVFDVQSEDHVIVLTIRSETLAFADLRLTIEMEQIRTHLDEVDQPQVLVDFTRIHYFTSTLLEALRNLWVQTKERNGRMAVCGLNEEGREILELARFDTIWDVFETKSDALPALKTETA